MLRSKNTAGFTLIELIIVVALISIFIAFALPNFGRLIERNRTQTAAEDLVEQLQYAKNEAAFKGRIVTVVNTSGNAGRWDLGLQIYQSGNRTTNRTFNAALNDTSLKLHQGMNSPTLIAKGSAGIQSWLSFRPSGQLDIAGPQTIIICQTNTSPPINDPALGKQITLQPDGTISIAALAPTSCTP